MPKLTPAEKTALTSSSNKAAKFLTGKRTAAEDLDKVFALVEGLKGRKKPPIIGKEAIALWQAKIDFAVANRDTILLDRLTRFPKDPADIIKKIVGGGGVAWWDNGGCNCGGGGGGPSGW